MDRTQEASTPLALLCKQITERLEEFDDQVSFWRPRAFFGHISVAVLGAMITLFAGLNVSAWTPPNNQVLQIVLQRQNLILVLGVLITVISAWQAFYNHRERWVGYASLAERLRGLLAKVEFRSHVSAPTDAGEDLCKEFEAILAEIGRIEAKAMSKKDSEEVEGDKKKQDKGGDKDVSR